MAYEDQDNSGLSKIALERYGQIHREGYAPDGDIGRSLELVKAAWCYIACAGSTAEFGEGLSVDELGGQWPWAPEFYKPETPERALEKAGALIAAAIDALTEEKKNAQ